MLPVRARHVAGHAVDERIVVGLNHDVIGAGQAKIGVDAAADFLGVRGGKPQEGGAKRQGEAT